MKSGIVQSSQLMAVFVCAVLLITGCTTYADKPPSEGHELATDEGNVSIDRDSYHQALLREDMRAMTISVRKLLVLDSRADVSAKDRHRQVIRELNNLEGIARIIKEDGEITNYSTLSPYLGSFLRDVSMARELAKQSPPDYQPATWLIKSCLVCHKNI